MSSCPLLATCDSAKVCDWCGGLGICIGCMKTGQYECSERCHDTICRECHGTGRTCDRTECRVLDATCDAIVKADHICSTCGRSEMDIECFIECVQNSEWMPPRYSSDNAPRKVLADVMGSIQLMILHRIRVFILRAGFNDMNAPAYIITRAIVAAGMEVDNG